MTAEDSGEAIKRLILCDCKEWLQNFGVGDGLVP